MSQGTKGDGAHPSRKALLVGNSAYVDPAITPLLAPRTDIEKLGALLSDPAIGGFDVAPPQLDISADEFRLAISNLFADAKKNDLLLLYFAGHGVRDNNGRLYLAVRKTQIKRLNATALPAQFILDEMSKSASRRKVLILDCCHAGAVFEDGTLRARSAAYDAGLVRDSFLPVGTGTYILAASQSGQSAFEEIDPETKTAKSIYTGLIVDAISTGNAAPDSKDITVSDIHDYIREHRNRDGVETTPELTVFNQSDTLVLCSNPNVRKPLDQRLLDQLVSQNLTERNFAIDQLIKVLGGKDAYQAGLVQTAFEGRLNTDPQGKERDFELRDKLQAALDVYLARVQPAPSLVDQQNTGVSSAEATANVVGKGVAQPSTKKSELKASEQDAVPANPPPRWSWKRRIGIAMLSLAVLLYLGLVAVNIGDQRGDYELTWGNVIRLARLGSPVLKEVVVVLPQPTPPAPDDDDPDPEPPKPKAGPIESLALGKWRVLLFSVSDCDVAKSYATNIRRMIQRRVDFTRFSKQDPYNLVIDTGSDDSLAEQLFTEMRGKLIADREFGYKLLDSKVVENPGEYADYSCLSEDQATEFNLASLISDFTGPDRIESGNRIVDLYAKTVNKATKDMISEKLIDEITPRSGRRVTVDGATYAARTLSLLRPCFNYNRRVADVTSMMGLPDTAKFFTFWEAAEANFCKPGN